MCHASFSGCEGEKRDLIPDSLLSIKYDSANRKLGFFYDKEDLKIQNELVLDTYYRIKILQERKKNGEYVLSVEKDGTKIYDNINPTLFLLPSANIYFSKDEGVSLGSAAMIENVSIIKGD